MVVPMKSKWLALATDFDGTIASEGVVSPKTLQALREARHVGVALLLVTGREMRDFRSVGFDLSVFDLVIAENGALLHDPHFNTDEAVAPSPPSAFLDDLRGRGVPFSVGKSIVATVEPYEIPVLESIRELHLDLTVTFNKGAVMVLPPNVNKAAGLLHALAKLDILPASVIAVGDGENDHSFLSAVGLPVAVASAVMSLKEHARLVTTGGAGQGVEELIRLWLAGQLEALP